MKARGLLLIFHSYGENVLTQQKVKQIFNATDTILFNDPMYHEVCADGHINVTLPNGTDITTCIVQGVNRFWNFSSILYGFTMSNDTDVQMAVSSPTFPDGSTVVRSDIFGRLTIDNTTSPELITSIESFMLYYLLPDTELAISVELDWVHAFTELSEQWQSNPSTAGFYIEAVSMGSFAEEFTNGILIDLPLVPFAFVIMVGFACYYFYRFDQVKSRTMLGFAAVMCVVVSVLFSYGCLFIIGVPFTVMTQLIPFIIFGIGLDDAFIIVDTYERTADSITSPVSLRNGQQSQQQQKSVEERMIETIDSAGISVALTSITSTIAFALGCLSKNIPLTTRVVSPKIGSISDRIS